jgi:hypothetical protein
MFEHKVTHLRRCCTNLPNHKIGPHVLSVRSGFRFACALHLGNFSFKHGVLFRYF